MNIYNKHQCGYYTVVFNPIQLDHIKNAVDSIITQSNYPICIVTNNTYSEQLPVHACIRPIILNWPDNLYLLAKASAEIYSPWDRTFLIEPAWFLKSNSVDTVFDTLDGCDLCMQTVGTITSTSARYGSYNQLAVLFDMPQWYPLQQYLPWFLFNRNLVTCELFSQWRALLHVAQTSKLKRRCEEEYTFSFAVKHVLTKFNARLQHLYLYSAKGKNDAIFTKSVPSELLKEKAIEYNIPSELLKEKAIEYNIPSELLKEKAIEYNIPLELLPPVNTEPNTQ